MLDEYFTLPEILRRHRAGLFGAHLDSFTSTEKELGYPRATVRAHCFLVRMFGRWLERRGKSIEQIDDDLVAEFGRAQRHVGLVHQAGTKPLRRLVALLRVADAVPLQASAPRTEADALAHRFGAYLERRRAVKPTTVVRHVPIVQLFLRQCFGQGSLALRTLGEKDITRFVLDTAKRYSPRTQQTHISILRSFFRFLLEQGEIQTDLSGVVPTVPQSRAAGVPKFLTPSQVERALASCDRCTAKGRRDRAILLLLARLGLRACEVSRLELGDICWRTGELVVRGKGSSLEKLPLLADVGEALASYIEKDRPRCGTRRVFTRMRAPIAAIANKGTVTTIVRDATRRAGLDVPNRGAHIFRHSLATNMLRDGASMSEIGTVLRHRSPATTEIYAKVDITSLQRLAQPWPVRGVR